MDKGLFEGMELDQPMNKDSSESLAGIVDYEDKETFDEIIYLPYEQQLKEIERRVKELKGKDYLGRHRNNS